MRHANCPARKSAAATCGSLFHLVLRCMRAGRPEPIIRPSERIAAHCYAAGIDLAEVQEAFDVVAEVLWRHLVEELGL